MSAETNSDEAAAKRGRLRLTTLLGERKVTMKTKTGSHVWSIEEWRGGFDYPGAADEETTGITEPEEAVPEPYEEELLGEPPLDDYYDCSDDLEMLDESEVIV